MQDPVHQVIVLGSTAVGKTSMISQFVHGPMNQSHQPTVGIDFFVKVVTVGDLNVRLQIWDTAGQEHFNSVTPSYIRKATVAVLVFDITQRSTFEDLKKLYQMVTDIADPAFVIVGNKVDLEASRAVETHEAKQYANDLGAKYFETSAVIPLNINELFVGISTCPFEKPRKQDTARAVSAPVVREITISQAIDSRPAAGCAC